MVNVERNSKGVTLACEVDGATSYEWERQDGAIPSSAIGVNSDTLTLVDLQQCDTGNYRCVASNDDNLSTPSKYAKITIKGLLVLYFNLVPMHNIGYIDLNFFDAHLLRKIQNLGVCVYLFLGQSVTISISKSVIVKHHASLRKYINLESLIPHLNTYEILTKGERNLLNIPEISSQQKVDHLLQFLEDKSDESIQNFLKALKDADEHTGHRQLLDVLNQTQS